MTVLTAPINKHTGLISVDTPLDNPSYPLFYTIDSEKIEVIDQADTNQWEVERGIAGTQAAKHNRAVSLVSISSPYSGGGSSVPDPSGAPDGQVPIVTDGAYALGIVPTVTLTGTQTTLRQIYIGDEDPVVAHAADLIPGDIWIDTTGGLPFVTKITTDGTGWILQAIVWKVNGGNSIVTIEGDGQIDVMRGTSGLFVTADGAAGGNVSLQTAAASVEAHTDGSVVLSGSGVVMAYSLPTADPGNAEQLWNDAGTLKVSAG